MLPTSLAGEFPDAPLVFLLLSGVALAGDRVFDSNSNDDLHSLARKPNGTDKNNAAADWLLVTTITPGAAN